MTSRTKCNKNVTSIRYNYNIYQCCYKRKNNEKTATDSNECRRLGNAGGKDHCIGCNVAGCNKLVYCYYYIKYVNKGICIKYPLYSSID